MSLPATKFALQLLDRAAVATRLIYYADEDLRKWSNGRIYRNEFAMVPSRGNLWPAIYVSLGVADEVTKVGDCVDLLWGITTSFVWHPTQEGLRDTEPSIASVVLHAKRLLKANDGLAVDLYDDENLADRGPEFDPTDLQGEVEVDGKFLLRQAFTANYQRLDAPASTLGPVYPVAP